MHDSPQPGRAKCTSESKVLPLAIERAGVDSQDARGVVEGGGLSQNEPDVFGLELIESDGLADLDRGGRSRSRVMSGRRDAAWQIAQPE